MQADVSSGPEIVGCCFGFFFFLLWIFDTEAQGHIMMMGLWFWGYVSTVTKPGGGRGSGDLGVSSHFVVL